MQDPIPTCTTDQLLTVAPWVFAGIVFLILFKSPRYWKGIGITGIIVGICAFGISRIYLRPSILRHQLSPLHLMEHRNVTAQRNIDAGRFQAAESLLFQVLSEARQIQRSRWTLPVARKRTHSIEQVAEHCGSLLVRKGSEIANRLGKALQGRDFLEAVNIFSSAELDSTDVTCAVFQEFLWHVINDEIIAADSCLKRLSGTDIDLAELRWFLDSGSNRANIGALRQEIIQLWLIHSSWENDS